MFCGSLITLATATPGVTRVNTAASARSSEAESSWRSPSTAREVARSEAASRLKDGVAALAAGATLTVRLLKGMVPDTDTYRLTDLHYQAEYADAGVRVHQQDVTLPLSGLERLWIRRVALAGGGAA